MSSIPTITAIHVQPVGNNEQKSTLADKLSELESVRKQGLITQKEFQKNKATILQNFSAFGDDSVGVVPTAPTLMSMQMVTRQNLVVPHQEFVPSNKSSEAQYYARIAFPIAGHPEFDKGAYHHPMGCCCYTPDRSDASEDVSAQCFFMPVTIACYVGTLCYQPCGICCAHQCPWLGDCPFTEQRVTSKFKRLYPEKITRVERPLLLTIKGSPNQCIFENTEDLKNGRRIPLVLRSHPGRVIKKSFSVEKKISHWRYIVSNCDEGGRHDAVQVQLEDGEFLKLSDCDLVLDISFWKHDVGNTVNFVGGHGSGKKRTKLHGGGRSWVVNDDGTISTKNRPDLVLGV